MLRVLDEIKACSSDAAFVARTAQVRDPLHRCLAADSGVHAHHCRVVGVAYILLALHILPNVKEHFVSVYTTDSLERQRALHLIRSIIPKMLEQATYGRSGIVSLPAFVEECVFLYLVEI